MTDDERTRAAFARLQEVLTHVASSMVGRIHERCPYRARDDRCTFAGGCRNQRRQAGGARAAGGAPDAETATSAAQGERVLWCGGDHQLQRTGT